MILIVVISSLIVAAAFIGKIFYDVKKYTKFLKATTNVETQLDSDERTTIEHLTMKEIDDLHNDGYTIIERNGRTYTIRNANWNPSTKNSQPSSILK